MDLNPDRIMPLPGIRESACLVRFSSIRHTSARSVSRIKVVFLHCSFPILAGSSEGYFELFIVCSDLHGCCSKIRSFKNLDVVGPINATRIALASYQPSRLR